MRKKSKGRRKIEITRLEDEDKIHVAFSKRRNGRVKLANEFSILTGAEISLAVFSSGDRVYPSGATNAQTIIKRYENQTNGSVSTANSNLDLLAQASSSAKQQDLNSKPSLLKREMVNLRRRQKLLNQLMERHKINKAKAASISLENQFKDLSLNKLEDVQESAKSLRDNAEKEIVKKTAPFSQRKPYGMSEDFPSIFDLFRRSSSSNNAITAGVVRYAGPSRFINGWS